MIGWCFRTKSHSASQQKPVDWSRRTTICGICFDPRSIFDLLWRVKGQFSVIFGKKRRFFTFQSRYWQIYERQQHGAFTSVFLAHWSTISHAFWEHNFRYCRCISLGKPQGHVCRPASALAGRPLRAWEFAVACIDMKMQPLRLKWTSDSSSGPQETPICITIAYKPT